MSFLVDPPLLFGTGVAIDAAVDDERVAKGLEAGVLVLFLVTSVSLYLNARWVHWLARLCRAETGRDWMLNSAVFHFEHRRARAPTHVAAALLFLTYPLWLRLGRRAGGRLSGRG